MAVSKMQKCTILVENASNIQLFHAIQELQSFEPIQLDKTDDKLSVKNTQLQEYLADVQRAQLILKNASSSKATIIRQQLTYDALEKLGFDFKSEQLVEQVLSIADERHENDKKIERLVQKSNDLLKWKKLPLLPSEVNRMTHIQSVVGTIPQFKTDELFQKIKQHPQLFVETLFHTQTEQGIAVYFETEDKATVIDFLEDQQFAIYKYPFEQLPEDELLNVNDELSQLKMKQNDLLEQLRHIHDTRLQDLYLLEEVVQNELLREFAQLTLEEGKYVVSLSGWIIENKVAALKRILEFNFPNHQYALLLNDQPVDISQVPIALENHPLVEPFELLTEMYSLPKYDEIDPTPYMMPFYATFFGLMVADIGYGLLMFLGTLFLLKKGNLTASFKKNIKLFHILSYPIMLWGLFFASFFSFDLGFAVMSATNDGLSLIIMSVLFGLIQLMFGLAINAKELFKKKDIPAAVSDGLAWVGLLFGVILFALSGQQQFIALKPIANFVLIGSAISIVVFTILGSKNKLLGIGSGLYKLYGVSAYIGDIASYTRLMALCVAGASIGGAFNQIIMMLPVFARFSVGIVIFIALHALNFGLAVLGAYVHGIRLMFVEFFGKFYEGGGKKHQPLKTYEKYVDLKERHLEE